jgi:hypothetical protein
MKTFLHTAVATIMLGLQPVSTSLAQTAPEPAAAATPAPAPSEAAPSTPAAASTDKAGASEGKAAASAEPAKRKAPKRIKISSQTRHEIERSLKTGTVPSRYRSQVPKEYQKYIPFEK